MGPNAPLSCAVAEQLECGLPPPAGELVDADGAHIERSETTPAPEKTQPQSEFVPVPAEIRNKYGPDAVEY